MVSLSLDQVMAADIDLKNRVISKQYPGSPAFELFSLTFSEVKTCFTGASLASSSKFVEMMIWTLWIFKTIDDTGAFHVSDDVAMDSSWIC